LEFWLVYLIRDWLLETHTERISEEDLAHARGELNMIVDVTAEELREIADRALSHAETADTDEDTGLVMNMGSSNCVRTRDGGYTRRSIHYAISPYSALPCIHWRLSTAC